MEKEGIFLKKGAVGGGTRVGNQEREEVGKTSTSRQSEEGGEGIVVKNTASMKVEAHLP